MLDKTADQDPRSRPARPLRRDRRREIRHHRSAERRRRIWSRCATCSRGTRRWCCGRARSRRSSAILKLANDTATPIVPQGGNTGLVGGQIPLNTTRSCSRSTGSTASARSIRPRTPSPARPASPCSARARPPPRWTGSIRNCCPRKAPAPSAATFRPMPAAPPRSPTASRARTCSASRWCSPTAACSTTSTS